MNEEDFLEIKDGWPNFWGEPILQNVWIIWSPLLCFNFKTFLDPNFWSFIRFQCILYDSGVLLSRFSNLYKLKRRDFISGGTNFSECLNYLVHPSVFKFQKCFRPKFFVIHEISIHSAWIRKIFLRVVKFLQIKKGGLNF